MTEAKSEETQESGRRYCDAKKQSDGTCKNSAGFKTSHPGYGRCHLHGGTSTNLVKAAAKEEVASLATDIDVDPDTVILSTIGRAWGAVYWCAERIEAIQAEADSMFAAEETASVLRRRGELSKMLLAFNKLYGDWMDRANHYAVVAKNAGIEERRIKLEEDKRKQAKDIMLGVLTDLGINLDSPEVKEAFRRNFSLIQGGAA